MGGMAGSHSARSAWIETSYPRNTRKDAIGRTPQGVRGLKLDPIPRESDFQTSHSARSAWIETATNGLRCMLLWVALRKECVD